MKKKNSIVITLAALICMGACSANIQTAGAATKEEVVAAARKAGFPEVGIQQGLNYAQSRDFTPEQYDKIIESIESYDGLTYEAIVAFLEASGMEVEQPSQDQIIDNPDNAANDAEGASSEEAEKDMTDDSGQTGSENMVAFSELSDEEQKAYVDGMTKVEKNRIIKGLDSTKKLEIVDKLIETSGELGMNVTVDDISQDSIRYSIRDDKGGLLDIASIGASTVDDTGIDYTVLLLGCLAVLILSCFGFILFSRMQKTN